jgi:hypothetical protein
MGSTNTYNQLSHRATPSMLQQRKPVFAPPAGGPVYKTPVPGPAAPLPVIYF